MNRKSVVVGLTVVAVVVVLGLAIFLITQPPAAKEETAGAIGAAQRYRSEQIKEGDTGIDVGTTGPVAPITSAEFADLLGRAGVDLRIDALNNVSFEQQAAIWGAASPLEKFDAYFRLDPATQRQIADRFSPTERAAWEKAAVERAAVERAAVDRAAQEKLSGEALGRATADLRIDALNKASLEQQSAMFGKLDPLAKFDAYFRLDPSTQRHVVDRFSPTERAAWEKAALERASLDRAATERAATERAATERANQEP